MCVYIYVCEIDVYFSLSFSENQNMNLGEGRRRLLAIYEGGRVGNPVGLCFGCLSAMGCTLSFSVAYY